MEFLFSPDLFQKSDLPGLLLSSAIAAERDCRSSPNSLSCLPLGMGYHHIATLILHRLSCSLISTIATLHLLLAFALVALAIPATTQHDNRPYLHSGYNYKGYDTSQLRSIGPHESTSSTAPSTRPLDARKPTISSYVTTKTIVTRNSNIRHNETNSLDSTLIRVCTNILSLNPLSRSDKHRYLDYSRTFDEPANNGLLHEMNLFECFLILDFTWCAFLFTSAACLLWITLPYLRAPLFTILTNTWYAIQNGLLNFNVVSGQFIFYWSGTVCEVKLFFTRYLLPIFLDYTLFCIDDYILAHSTLSSDLLHDPNNSYFLHIVCLNSDLTVAYRHLFMSILECALKRRPLLRVYPEKIWSARSPDRLRPRFDISSSTDDSFLCSDSRPNSLRDLARVKTNADAHKADAFQTPFLPCQFTSGSISNPSSTFPSKSCSQFTSLTPSDGNDQDTSHHSSAEDGSSKGNSKSNNSGTTSPTTAGSLTISSNDDGDDDDDDDDGNNGINLECLKSYVLIEDDNKDEESETEHEDDCENTPVSPNENAKSPPSPETPIPDRSSLHLNLDSPVPAATKKWSPMFRNTPTEEMLEACEESSLVQRLKTLPTIPGTNDPHVRYKNLSAVSGYISTDNGASPATLQRDILHDKNLVPGKAANILKDQLGSNVPFVTKRCEGHQRDLVMFSSRYFQIENWDCYNLSESEDIPLML